MLSDLKSLEGQRYQKKTFISDSTLDKNSGSTDSTK
jgi:hypothetical protein